MGDTCIWEVGGCWDMTAESGDPKQMESEECPHGGDVKTKSLKFAKLSFSVPICYHHFIVHDTLMKLINLGHDSTIVFAMSKSEREDLLLSEFVG